MPVNNQRFNLRLWFAIASFGTITLICLFSAYFLSDFLSSSLLERESEVSQEFLESIVSIDGSAMFKDDGAEPFTQSPLLLDYARHITSMPGIIRVNIHAPTHRIIWSTEKQLVGKVFDVNHELAEAFRGHRVTEIGTFSTDSKAEHVALSDAGYFIEAYIPIRSDGGRGPVVGVVEFYKLPLALHETIQRGRRLVWSSAGIAAIVLFLALYFVVQRGAKIIERQQQHMAQMEAFAAIGQMSSAVAHSLRNPMSAIRTSAELWKSQQPDDTQGVTDEVIREVDRMDSYVRELLAYARSEPYHMQPVNPVAVVSTILQKLRRPIERNKIDVRLPLNTASPTLVMADEMLLEQALTSVLTNAIEAMPTGGQLAISLDTAGAKGRVRMAISDTGRGIPEELLQRVAQSYFTTKTHGLGLGLVLARGIIERFRGYMEIASTHGVGTTVVVDLVSA